MTVQDKLSFGHLLDRSILQDQVKNNRRGLEETAAILRDSVSRIDAVLRSLPKEEKR